MLDYLLDAMNEISDEHITEAVNYEAKAKKINLKKIIPMAACFVFIIVAVIAGAGLFESPPPSTEPTNIGEPTYTQAPIQNSTPFAPTQAPVRDWEELTYGERFGNITYGDKSYIYGFDMVSEKKIGEHISTVNLKVEYLLDDWHSATAEIYEVNFISTELLIAVRFAQDEKSEYYIYICPGYAPETLGDLLDDIDINNTVNLIGCTAIYHKEYANGDFTEVGYKINPEGHKVLSGLLWKNRDALRCKKDYHNNLYVNSYPETIRVRFEFLGEKTASIYIEAIDNKTHLYISYGTEQFCFELSESTFSDLYNYLEGKAGIEYFRQGCPTAPTGVLTTTPTIEGTTLPPTNENFNEVEKVLGTAETLGDVIDGFDIEKADYGISGDMTVDLFAHFEEKDKEETIYSIAADTKQQLVDFMQMHSESKAENRRCLADTRLIFSVYFMGNSGRISICNDGYLYLTCGGITKAFYVGEDAYRDFKENLIAVVWTTENPVTFG